MSKLAEAAKALIADVEAMNPNPGELFTNTKPDYWFGGFGDFQENDNGEALVLWPNLRIGIEALKKALTSESK